MLREMNSERLRFVLIVPLHLSTAYQSCFTLHIYCGQSQRLLLGLVAFSNKLDLTHTVLQKNEVRH